MRPLSNVFSPGIASRHCVIASGHRAANGHPVGGSTRSGGDAVDRHEPRHHDVERAACCCSSPAVYGCPGAAKSSSAVADLDDLAGVHHRDPVAQTGHDAEVVGDQQHRQAEALLEVGDETRGSGPGW